MADMQMTLKPGELGKLLGVNARTVRMWHKAGRLPAPERTLANHTRWNPHTVADAYREKGIELPARFAAYLKSIEPAGASS